MLRLDQWGFEEPVKLRRLAPPSVLPQHFQGRLDFQSESAQNLLCHKSISITVEENAITSYNWTSEKAETCDNGEFCQESILIIKAGTKAALVVSKGCVSGGMAQTTFIQHTSGPGLVIVSFSNFCEDPFCNNKASLSSFWMPSENTATSVLSTLSCPTCVALETCVYAPSLPCPRGSTRCYQGTFQITGGGINSVLEVKGCTAMIACKLMSGISTVGVFKVKEECPRHSFTELRRMENGATWLLVSVWGLAFLLLLILLLLQPLVHCS
ncbi:PREDICTED: testis-expressed sequence 101 protein [Chrysochloris asiatica]|uniref:Testis-expressed sequence 101 protein n=1 Tax=Chrysochloris asiatica TaxID=185453 RepID=A0A9B0TWF7_CHRAS|nr:PREDICTED: testis-expressed sequence 101 protein [Chrysochloris asiatica]